MIIISYRTCSIVNCWTPNTSPSTSPSQWTTRGSVWSNNWRDDI